MRNESKKMVCDSIALLFMDFVKKKEKEKEKEKNRKEKPGGCERKSNNS